MTGAKRIVAVGTTSTGGARAHGRPAGVAHAEQPDDGVRDAGRLVVVPHAEGGRGPDGHDALGAGHVLALHHYRVHRTGDTTL